MNNEAAVNKKVNVQNRSRLRTTVQIGMLGAVAAVLMLFEFPIPFIAPPFIKMDFSEIPVLIGTFAMGPLAGVFIELLKNLLNLVIHGTTTMGVGELSNFIIGCAFVVPAGLFYKMKKTRANALKGMAAGTLLMAAMGCLTNAFIMFPLYSTLMGIPMDSFIAMGTAIHPAIDNMVTFVILTVKRRISMAKINGITQKTHNPFVNLYELDRESKTGKKGKYYVASRAKDEKELKLRTRKNTPDGVIIYSLYGEKQDRVVLVRQYRYSIDDYIYEFPAGLVEADENFKEAGIREMKEETGLTFTPVEVDPAYEKPAFTTIGLTDESCAIVFGTAKGQISREFQEDTEEIEVVLADREEVRRILKEEKIAIMCSYMLMHFLHDEKPFDFLKEL